MSHPDEPAPPVTEAASPAALPAPPPALDEPVPSGAPYRVPAPPPPHAEAPEPELHVGPPPRRPRPIIGPALSVFAVSLWAFVVAGQFTTSWLFGAPLGQGAAVILVMLTTFAAWIASLRRGRIAVPPRTTTHLVGRGIGVTMLAFLFFFVCVVAATAAGSISSRNHDVLIALALVAISMLAAITGPRMTSPTPPERTHRQRFALVVLWIAGALLTLVAGVDLAANG